MILNNVTLINGNGPVNVQVIDGRMRPLTGTKTDCLQLTFNNALVFPGLVNAHDHLDFNLFPQLGDKIYNNYTEWGTYIHHQYKNEIAAVLKVPLALRVSWGIFKNLLCGVTTVVNHGEYLIINNAPINVEQGHSIHSIKFEKRWKIKLNNPFKIKQPVSIHVGEGNDIQSHQEIDELLNWNLLNKKLIGVHGVAMTTNQARKFEAMVWCPESNFFLLNKTASINHLKKHTTILFGTDSTLTGNWNIWGHIRLARKTNMLTDEELYNSLHNNAGTGSVVVAKKHEGNTPLDSFFATDPADILLVIYDNTIRLFDAELLEQLTTINLEKYNPVYINGTCKYVQGNLPQLIQQIKEYYPEATFPVTTN